MRRGRRFWGEFGILIGCVECREGFLVGWVAGLGVVVNRSILSKGIPLEVSDSLVDWQAGIIGRTYRPAMRAIEIRLYAVQCRPKILPYERVCSIKQSDNYDVCNHHSTAVAGSRKRAIIHDYV